MFKSWNSGRCTTYKCSDSLDPLYEAVAQMQESLHQKKEEVSSSLAQHESELISQKSAVSLSEVENREASFKSDTISLQEKWETLIVKHKKEMQRQESYEGTQAELQKLESSLKSVETPLAARQNTITSYEACERAKTVNIDIDKVAEDLKTVNQDINRSNLYRNKGIQGRIIGAINWLARLISKKSTMDLNNPAIPNEQRKVLSSLENAATHLIDTVKISEKFSQLHDCQDPVFTDRQLDSLEQSQKSMTETKQQLTEVRLSKSFVPSPHLTNRTSR
jgi:hypothetical protein